jgi:hypothetical protein
MEAALAELAELIRGHLGGSPEVHILTGPGFIPLP